MSGHALWAHEQSPMVVVVVETLTGLLLHRMVALGTHQLFGGTLINRDLLIWKEVRSALTSALLELETVLTEHLAQCDQGTEEVVCPCRLF